MLGWLNLGALMWAVSLGVVLIYVVTAWAIARVVGAPVHAVHVFVGPAIARLPIAGTIVVVHGLPIPASGLQFGPDNDDGAALAAVTPLRRLVLGFAPWLIVVLAAATVLGADAFASVGRGVVQLVSTPLTAEGRALVRELRVLAQGPVAPFAARFATKMAAYNVLPLPSLPAFVVLLIGWRASRLYAALHAIGLIAQLALLALWTATFVTA